jgi:hypothetical protein
LHHSQAQTRGETHGVRPITGTARTLADQATAIPVEIKRRGARTAQSNLLRAGDPRRRRKPPAPPIFLSDEFGQVAGETSHTAAMRRSSPAATSRSPQIAGEARRCTGRRSGAVTLLRSKRAMRSWTGAHRHGHEKVRPTIYLVFWMRAPPRSPIIFIFALCVVVSKWSGDDLGRRAGKPHRAGQIPKAQLLSHSAPIAGPGRPASPCATAGAGGEPNWTAIWQALTRLLAGPSLPRPRAGQCKHVT